MYDVYVKDNLKLGIHEFFKQESPAALEEITAVMLETARKGYWPATKEQLADVANLHTRLLEDHRPACTGFVCDNRKLQDFVALHTDKNRVEAYRKNIDGVREVQVEHAQNGVVLKKEELNRASQVQQDSGEGRKTLVIGGSHIDYSDGVSETEKINLIICVYYLNGRTARINGQSFLFLRH